MICPKCNSDLVTIGICGEEITWCQNCRGNWLDQGNLEKIVKKADCDDTSNNSGHMHDAIIEHFNMDANVNCEEVVPKKEKNIFSNFLTFR